MKNLIEIYSNDEVVINPNILIPDKLDPLLNIAILASGKGSNFEAIYNSIKANQLNAKISILIVNKDSCLAIEKAKRFNIDYLFIDHRNYSSRQEYDQEIVNILTRYKVEGIVMAGWMRIVTPVLINSFKNRIINIHPSILPSFKGTDSIKRALDSGVKITGCTVHKVIEEVDSGEIICQAAIRINPNDTIESLTSKIQFQEHKILPLSISLAANKWRRYN